MFTKHQAYKTTSIHSEAPASEKRRDVILRENYFLISSIREDVTVPFSSDVFLEGSRVR